MNRSAVKGGQTVQAVVAKGNGVNVLNQALAGPLNVPPARSG